ncbi:hypothetical protein PHPALM_29459 [Phytophthora palmivora]|uniref:Uncharacterized protein n=1 Tax=Phytophthora palmivora TaxID=4796 RepID=A0A2P4X7I3_9STRA|nr:hypothetical protein PHPALM_29459 [Phytophthora palmivora]
MHVLPLILTTVVAFVTISDVMKRHLKNEEVVVEEVEVEVEEAEAVEEVEGVVAVEGVELPLEAVDTIDQ